MTEFELTEDGIALSVPWQGHDHLNVRTEYGTINFHAEAKCGTTPAPPECSPIMQSAAQRIGESFIPWSDLGIAEPSCVEWVQFSRANYHFGENGEVPFCLGEPEPEIPDKPEVVKTYEVYTQDVDCNYPLDGWAFSLTKERLSTQDWWWNADAHEWVLEDMVHGEWVVRHKEVYQDPTCTPKPEEEQTPQPAPETSVSVPVQTSPDVGELAVTGSGDLGVLGLVGGLLGIVLLAGGLVLWTRASLRALNRKE